MKSIYQIWFLALGVKLVLSALLPLADDEAYYWVWSQHLQLSYFDHPPMVSWVFRLGHFLNDFYQAARWPAVIIGHITLLIWLKILEPVLNFEKLKAWLLLALFSPLIGPGSIIVTPDIPLVFFWSLSLWIFIKAVETPQISLYAALGLSLGLGFSSKYHIVLFPPLAVFWLWQQGLLTKNRLKPLWITLFTFLVGAAPVILWNLQNNWISFAFQLNHGLGGKSWKPSWTYMYLLGQLGLLFPTVVFFALKRGGNSQTQLLHLFGWGPILFFFLTSFKGRVEANWPIIAYPSLLGLALVQSKGLKWVRWTLAIWVTTFVIVLSEVAFRWIPISPDNLKTNEFWRFDKLAYVAQPYEPLFARSFQMASKLSFLLKRPVYKLRDFHRKDFFDFQEQSQPSTPFYFVAIKMGEPLPAWVNKKGHQIVERISVDDSYEIVKVLRP